MSKYIYDKNYFKKIDTTEKAYWLGFLYADGCITRFYKGEELRSMSLEITLKSEDRNHLEKFRECLNSNVPIKDKVVSNKYHACRIVINCTSMCNDLILLGCTPNKSLTLDFPKDNILPNEYISHFIRGYFDGDGCVYYNETNVYHKNNDKTYLQYHYSCTFTGNYKFLKELKNIIEKNGINVSKLYQDKRSNAIYIYIYGKENISNFRKFLYKESTVSLDRKLNKFIDIEENDCLKINNIA